MLLKVQNLSKSYHFRRHLYLKAEQKAVFKNISFELERGQNMLICGESGSGKSTIARILAMLERADSGEILFDGVNLAHLNFAQQRLVRKKLIYIFQEQKLALNPYKRILDLLCVVSENFGKKPNMSAIKGLFDDFELDSALLKVKVAQLSTGQAQRIGLIRALLLEPKLLVLDEVTAALDLSQSQKIIAYLLRHQKTQGTSYIFISHQEDLFRKICEKTLKMGVENIS